MPTGLQSLRGPNLTTYTTASNNANVTTDYGNPIPRNVDFTDQTAVDSAGETIKQVARTIVASWAIQPESKAEEAVDAMTSIAMCRKAALWDQANYGATPVEGFEQEHLLAATVKLFSVISTEGLRAMTNRYEVVAEGIRYLPDTGDAEVDDLLSTVVSEQVISALRKQVPGGPEVAVADTLESHLQAWRSVEPIRTEANRLIGKGEDRFDSLNFRGSAKSLEKAAKAWEGADRSKIAVAKALNQAAVSWRAVGEYGRGAVLLEAAGTIYKDARQPGEAARAFGDAASTWTRAGEHGRAALVYVTEARAWEAVDRQDSAADAWESALRVEVEEEPSLKG